MSGIFFALAVFVAIAVVLARVAARQLRAASVPKTFVIAHFDDVIGIVARYRCPCGRRPDVLGESPTSAGSAVQLECVCGQRDRLTFTLAN